MPVIATGNVDTAGYILQLSRAIVNDAAQSLAGNLLSINQPYTVTMLNAAYREFQSDLENNGSEIMVVDNYIAPQFPPSFSIDPGVVSYLSSTGCFDGYNSFPNPHLPADLDTPLRLWERPSGTVQNYIELQPVNDGLPSRPQSGTLQQWDWRGGQIFFVGVNQLTDIRMRYTRIFRDLVDENSLVEIPRCDRCLSFLMGRTYGVARGSPLYQYMDQKYNEALISFVQMTARKKQRGSHRRRPYGSSSGYWHSTYGTGY